MVWLCSTQPHLVWLRSPQRGPVWPRSAQLRLTCPCPAWLRPERRHRAWLCLAWLHPAWLCLVCYARPGSAWHGARSGTAQGIHGCARPARMAWPTCVPTLSVTALLSVPSPGTNANGDHKGRDSRHRRASGISLGTGKTRSEGRDVKATGGTRLGYSFRWMYPSTGRTKF